MFELQLISAAIDQWRELLRCELHRIWEQRIKSWFPNLQDGKFSIDSPDTQTYNCIAWAGLDDENWWEPDPWSQYAWPIVNRVYTRECYVEAFTSLGFEICVGAHEETGYLKVALFENQSGLFHMARLVSGEVWTSKCGRGPDMTHLLAEIEGTIYGKVVAFLKRPLT